MGFPPPSGGGVASVFTRTGAVTAAAGDYTGVASGSVGIANLALASASTIAITGPGTYFVTGTTAINIVNGAARGCVITLVASGQAAGICVILNNATTANALNLRDNANLGIYAGESVTLVYNGTYWLEAARALKTVLATVSVTSNVTVTATTEATAAAVATLPAITFDGATPMKIEFYCGYTSLSVVAAIGQTAVWDSSTEVNKFTYIEQVYTSNIGVAISLPITPTAAAHTYSVRGWVSSGNTTYYAGTVGGGAGVYGPIYMAISRAI